MNVNLRSSLVLYIVGLSVTASTCSNSQTYSTSTIIRVPIGELCSETNDTSINITNSAAVVVVFDTETYYYHNSTNPYYYNPTKDLDCTVRIGADTSDSRLRFDFKNRPSSYMILTDNAGGTSAKAQLSIWTEGNPSTVYTNTAASILNQNASSDAVYLRLTVDRNANTNDTVFQLGWSCDSTPNLIGYNCSLNGAASTLFNASTYSDQNCTTNSSAVGVNCTCETAFNYSTCVYHAGPAVTFTFDFTVYIDGECEDSSFFQCYEVVNSTAISAAPSRCVDYSTVCDPYYSPNCLDSSLLAYDVLPADDGGVCNYDYTAAPNYGPGYVSLWLPWLAVLALLPLLLWCCWRPGWCPWRLARLRHVRCCRKLCCSQACGRSGPCTRKCSCGCCGPSIVCCGRRCCNCCVDRRGTGGVVPQATASAADGKTNKSLLSADPFSTMKKLSRQNAFMLGWKDSKPPAGHQLPPVPYMFGSDIKRENAFLKDR